VPELPTFDCVIGADRKFTLTLRDDSGSAITTYTGSATLDASVWGGDDLYESFDATATWVDAAAGTIRLTLAKADTATLEPGVYQVLLSITASGVTSSRPVLLLNMLAGPGSTVALTKYGSYDGMLGIAGSTLPNLLTHTDQAGAAEFLHRARMEFERLIQSRYRGGVSYRRQANLDHLLFGGHREYRSGYQDATLQDYLDDDYLVLDGPTGDAIKRWNNLLACAYLYERQSGAGGDGAGGYRSQAASWRAEAAAIASCLVVGVKASANDTIPTHQINLGVVDTLRL
jgi:hypothetical protein